MSENVDFNDIHQESGLGTVRDQVQAAVDQMLNRSFQNPFNDSAIGPQKFVKLVDLQNRKPPKSLIRGMVPENSLISLTGATGSKKSFLAIDMGFCIAAGIDFHGRKVIQAPVLYIAAEGQTGLFHRAKGRQIEYGIALPSDFHVLGQPVDLLNVDDIKMVAEFITENEIKLVVVDTFARCFIGDENSAKDVGAAIANVTKHWIGAGASVLLVHHTGHGASDRARGSSAYRAAMDVEIGTEFVTDGVRLNCWKSKEFEPWPPEEYGSKTVDVFEFDEDGEPISTLVLEKRALSPKSVKLTHKEDKVLSELRKLGDEFSIEKAKEITYPVISTRNKGQSLTRLLTKLEEHEILSYHDDIYRFNGTQVPK